MYTAVKKIKAIWRYTESLEIHSGATAAHWEDNTSCISVSEYKIVTPRVKHIDTTVCFLQEKIDNVIFFLRDEKSSVMPEYMCPKKCTGPIIIRSTKYMTGFRFYPTSDTEHYQLMILHEFVVK